MSHESWMDPMGSIHIDSNCYFERNILNKKQHCRGKCCLVGNSYILSRDTRNDQKDHSPKPCLVVVAWHLSNEESSHSADLFRPLQRPTLAGLETHIKTDTPFSSCVYCIAFTSSITVQHLNHLSKTLSWSSKMWWPLWSSFAMLPAQYQWEVIVWFTASHETLMIRMVNVVGKGNTPSQNHDGDGRW